MKRAVVGMSGGVDSFVTALMLQQQGFEVTGVTLDLWEKKDSPELDSLCARLGIELLHWDGQKIFRQWVVGSFVDEYLAGKTPSPCCICNSCVKWSLLQQAADHLGIEWIATGHYVRTEHCGDHCYIRKGVDVRKDQSYFLWGVSDEIRNRMLTPLGDYTKDAVKAFAKAQGYERMAEKKESMGICFLEGGDYRDFISQRVENNHPGEKTGHILNVRGEIIGTHTGVLNYTIGQKRGMPLLDGRPLYVSLIDVVGNTIVADVKDALFCCSLALEQVKSVRREDLFADNVEIKIRGLGLNPAGYVKVRETGKGEVAVELASPAWAVAPGQPAAFYRGDLLIGGGVIK